MRKEEMKEILGLLNAAGVNPQLCNYKLHVSSCPAMCGLPTMPGDDGYGEGMLVPEELLGFEPELFIPARGDSMAGAGFADGDLLRVRLSVSARDGDIVVALVDGMATVKVLFSDDEGRRWLVPCNERYDAILLTAEDNVRILGTVVGVEKRVVRASSGDCLKAIRRTVARRQEPSRPTQAQVDTVIAAVAAEVRNGRQWYAVYRALADLGGVAEGCFREFSERVARVVPGHPSLPVSKELGRLAVQSFRKRVALWDASDAPVSGQRFAEYRRIAQLTAARISESCGR